MSEPAGTGGSHGGRRQAGLQPHEWKQLGAFVLLVAAVGMWDGRLAIGAVGVAALVVLVKHADDVGRFLT